MKIRERARALLVSLFAATGGLHASDGGVQDLDYVWEKHLSEQWRPPKFPCRPVRRCRSAAARMRPEGGHSNAQPQLRGPCWLLLLSELASEASSRLDCRLQRPLLP